MGVFGLAKQGGGQHYDGGTLIATGNKSRMGSRFLLLTV